MLDLSLKEEVKTLKENLAERHTEITSLKEIMTKKDTLILEVREGKELKTKLSKSNTKLIGNIPLSSAKHIL